MICQLSPSKLLKSRLPNQKLEAYCAKACIRGFAGGDGTPSHNLPINNLPINNLPINNLPINNLPINNLPFSFFPEKPVGSVNRH